LYKQNCRNCHRGIQDLQSESSSSIDQSDSKSDNSAKDVSYNADWATSGHNVNILFDDIRELSAEKTNICSRQKIKEKMMINIMKSKNQDVDWMSTNK
jgi:hypothetical protein